MFGLEKVVAEKTPAVSAHEQLIGEIRQNDIDLDTLGEKLQAFRAQHFVMADGRLSIATDDPAARMNLEKEWRSLLTERDVLLRTRNSLLARL